MGDFLLLPAVIAAREDLTFGSKVIYAVLLSRATPGGGCIATHAELAKAAGCCLRSSYDAVRQLDKAGLLAIRRTRGRKANTYRPLPLKKGVPPRG